MSYTKQTWSNGDVITEAKLNHMEDGIASGANTLLVTPADSNDSWVFDKTWQEIHDAFFNGMNVIINYPNSAEYGLVQYVKEDPYGHMWTVVYFDLGAEGHMSTALTHAADGYPVIQS